MTYEDLQQQELHEKVDSTEKKLNDLQKEVTDLSIISKLRKKKDIENELNTVKTDLEELKKNANLSDTDKEKITKMETTNTELLASIQTELFDLKWDIENQWQDATRRQKNKTNVLIGAGTLGIWLLILRWRKKIQERKAAENPDAPPKKWWLLWTLGAAAIGVGTFFGIKAIVGPEKWRQFRNWLWLKDKEWDNEEEAETETINEDLSAEEIQKRNEYIEKSIKESTTMPITIDYGPDKDLFEKKWCPKTISFDANNQNIMLGQNNKINIKTKPFTLWGKSIISSRFQTIQPVANGFEVTMQTGHVEWFRPVMQMQKVTISKEEFIAMLSPYYTQQTQEYDVNINNGGENIPLHISTSREIQSQVWEDVDAVFESLNTFKKGQYTKFGTSINGYYKSLNGINNEYGQDSDLLWSWAETDEKLEKNIGAIPAMMDEKFDNVGDIIKDTMLERVKNIWDITTDKIAGFLEKYKDNPTFGKVLSKLSSFLGNLFSNWGTIDMRKLEEVFQSDPGMKQKVSLLMWKMSKIKWYLADHQDSILTKIKSEHPSRTESQQKDELKRIYLDLKIVGENASSASALKTLETYGLLNRLNENREFTVKAQKIAAELQRDIQATNISRDVATIADRGNIEYDPSTQRLRSRWLSTEIEIVSKDNNKTVYKLKNGKIGLGIEFTDIRELLWTANFLNWTDYTYKKNLLKTHGSKLLNMALPDFLGIYCPKFQYVDTNVYTASDPNKWIVGTAINVAEKIPWVWSLLWIAKTVVKTAAEVVPVVWTVVNGVRSVSVAGTTGIRTESDIMNSGTWSTGVMSKDKIEQNAPTLLSGNNMDSFVAYMNQRMVHFDPLDDFWQKMKRMWGTIAESLTRLVG